jgi:ABC-type transport system involved in multi-copper enzyme maturation permease subunit
VFRNNPVLQRELILNLRQNRAFVLLLVYQLVMAFVVLIAYPRSNFINLNVDSADARKLADYFFLGQFLLISLMVPSFAAGSIAGEKERKTYEMLLASPLRPIAIVIGKLVASLAHLLLLMVASLPIVFICLPLGGISLEEVAAAYIAILFAIIMFGCISVTCSSVFKRVSSALVVSYMVIAPFILIGILFWIAMATEGAFRLTVVSGVFPVIATAVSAVLIFYTSRRLLYPHDVGSMGEEVVDIEGEQENAVGLVIQRDRFPDRFFAPPRRTQLIDDRANPVYDKELHAELFSQGTLMLRIVIQVSMFLAVFMMAAFLFISPVNFRYYIDYVLAFNTLATTVFAAGSISSERERQTLDLLLTTTLTGWQILVGKFLAGFRVSYVLTLFLLWPVVLAVALTDELRPNILTMLLCVAIITICAIVNCVLAIFCSAIFKRTLHAMIATFAFIGMFYLLPPIAMVIAKGTVGATDLASSLKWLGLFSPFAAVHYVPLQYDIARDDGAIADTSLTFVLYYFVASVVLIAACIAGLAYVFRNRWWLTGRG